MFPTVYAMVPFFLVGGGGWWGGGLLLGEGITAVAKRPYMGFRVSLG